MGSKIEIKSWFPLKWFTGITITMFKKLTPITRINSDEQCSYDHAVNRMFCAVATFACFPHKAWSWKPIQFWANKFSFYKLPSMFTNKHSYNHHIWFGSRRRREEVMRTGMRWCNLFNINFTLNWWQECFIIYNSITSNCSTGFERN